MKDAISTLTFYYLYGKMGSEKSTLFLNTFLSRNFNESNITDLNEIKDYAIHLIEFGVFVPNAIEIIKDYLTDLTDYLTNPNHYEQTRSENQSL